MLDVGSGSGYVAACLARMVGPAGQCIGVEHIGELVAMSVENVKRDDASLLDSGRLRLLHADGRWGAPAEGPYDGIHVGAAAPSVPDELLAQLRPGGPMVVPVGPKGMTQRLLIFDKDEGGAVRRTDHSSVVFVPLTDDAAQLDKGNSTKISLRALVGL